MLVPVLNASRLMPVVSRINLLSYTIIYTRKNVLIFCVSETWLNDGVSDRLIYFDATDRQIVKEEAFVCLYPKP